MFSYKWTHQDWGEFWKDVLEGLSDEKTRDQMKTWRKQRHDDLTKRHFRRIRDV